MTFQLLDPIIRPSPHLQQHRPLLLQDRLWQSQPLVALPQPLCPFQLLGKQQCKHTRAGSCYPSFFFLIIYFSLHTQLGWVLGAQLEPEHSVAVHLAACTSALETLSTGHTSQTCTDSISKLRKFGKVDMETLLLCPFQPWLAPRSHYLYSSQ